MGYLDEAGLAALVGKVKGQMVELTAEEYAQIDPAIKNYDNKLYFVKNDVSGYQIDEEPTANSNGLVKSGGIYNWTSKIGSGSLITTAQTLIPAVNEVNAKIGSGTLTTTAQTLIPAVNEVNAKIGSGTLTTTAQTLISAVNEVDAKIGSTDISSIGDGTVTGAVDALNNSIVYRNFTVMGNGTTSATKDVALSGYTPVVAIATAAIGDLTAMTHLYNASISGNIATFMWSDAKPSSAGVGFTVIYKKNV